MGRASGESSIGVLPVSKYYSTHIRKSFSAPMIFVCRLTFLKEASIDLKTFSMFSFEPERRGL